MLTVAMFPTGLLFFLFAACPTLIPVEATKRLQTLDFPKVLNHLYMFFFIFPPNKFPISLFSRILATVVPFSFINPFFPPFFTPMKIASDVSVLHHSPLLLIGAPQRRGSGQ